MPMVRNIKPLRSKPNSSIVNLAIKIPLYHAFHAFGTPVLPPLSLTLCLTHRCNSRCITCKIYDDPVEEMSIEEWGKIFRGIGTGVLWFTITGGEPFIRDDISELLTSLLEHCSPKFITIPTNGYFSDVVPSIIHVLCRRFPVTNFILNISLDAVGVDHDNIRRLNNNYDRAMETFRLITNNKLSNLRVGFYTIISRFNAEKIPQIIDAVETLNPDSHLFEIAQPRRELSMQGVHVAPPKEIFRNISRLIRRKMSQKRQPDTNALIYAFRREYYRNVEKSFCDGKTLPPCYAGFASAYIAPEGTIYPCPDCPDPIGNLRSSESSLLKIWSSQKALDVRKKLIAERCTCLHSNAAYINALFHTPSLLRIGWNYISSNLIFNGVKNHHRLNRGTTK